jgi:hypothetical protein
MSQEYYLQSSSGTVCFLVIPWGILYSNLVLILEEILHLDYDLQVLTDFTAFLLDLYIYFPNILCMYRLYGSLSIQT